MEIDILICLRGAFQEVLGTFIAFSKIFGNKTREKVRS